LPLVGGGGGGPLLPFMSPPCHGMLLSLHAIVVIVVVCHHCHCHCLLSSPVIIVACRHLCCVLPGLCCVVIGHLVLGLANSKGEGGLTSLLFITWWPCRQLRCGNLGCCHCCLVSMWLVVQLVMLHCHVSHPVVVVGDQCGGWWALWVAVLMR